MLFFNADRKIDSETQNVIHTQYKELTNFHEPFSDQKIESGSQIVVTTLRKPTLNYRFTNGNQIDKAEAPKGGGGVGYQNGEPLNVANAKGPSVQKNTANVNKGFSHFNPS